MDIADKHYELIAVGSANPSIEFTIPRGDGTFVLDGFAHDTGHPLLLLEDGMILMESSQPREFGDFYRYAFSIAFLEGTPWGARPVFDTLDELIGFTERAIDIFARRILNCTW